MRPRAFLRRAAAPRGATTVEFAIALAVSLVLMFAMLELTRALYLQSAVQEVVRRAARAAAVTDFSRPQAMAAMRQNAIFHAGSGKLFLGGNIDGSYLRVSYASRNGPVTDMPGCPAKNVLNCARDPTANNCIRQVTVALCLPTESGDNACGPVPYVPVMPLIAPLFSRGGTLFGDNGTPLAIPDHAVTVVAGSLGHRPGDSPTCN
jgi:hypothetical protein